MRTAHLGRRKEQELVFFNHNGWKCSSTFVFLIRELDTKGCKSLIVCTLVLLGGIQSLVDSRTRRVGLWFFPFLFKSGRTLIDIVPFKRSRFTGVVMRTL